MHREQGHQIVSLEKFSKYSKKIDIITLYNLEIFLNKNDYTFKYEFSSNFFPTSSMIENIDIDHQLKKVEMVLNFTPFFGYSGMLSDYLLEKVIYEKNKSFMSFLNIFYDRIAKIYFKIKEIEHPFFSNGIYKKLLLSLIGIQDVSEYSYINYSSFFLANFRSKFGLEKLVSLFTGMEITVKEYVGGYVHYEEKYQSKLEKNNMLDGSNFLGRKYWDKKFGIDIILFPKNKDDETWFLNEEKFKKLNEIIAKYINLSLNYNIVIFPDKLTPCIIGKNIGNKLGKNTFLCLTEKNNSQYYLRV